jgi:hypothetical protein
MYPASDLERAVAVYRDAPVLTKTDRELHQAEANGRL